MHLRAEIFFVCFGILPFGVVVPRREVQLLNYVCCLCFTRLANASQAGMRTEAADYGGCFIQHFISISSFRRESIVLYRRG